MSKKIIIIITAFLVLILIGIFVIVQNFKKPISNETLFAVSSSSILISQSPEVKNPSIKNNQSEDTILENSNLSSKITIPQVTIPEKSRSSSSSESITKSLFIETKTFADNSKLYDLKGFDSSKLKDEPLITLKDYFPNSQNTTNLFVEKDSNKRFLGYGAVDSFQFDINNKKYNLTVFEDETGFSSLILTNGDYTDPKKLYVGFDYASGNFVQKNNSTKFVFDGTSDNGEIKNRITKTFDVKDIFDFNPID